MPKKLQSDDDDLMKIFEHYAELRREHAEYEELCTRSNATSRACKAGSTSSKNSTNNSPRNVISSWNATTGWSRKSS